MHSCRKQPRQTLCTVGAIVVVVSNSKHSSPSKEQFNHNVAFSVQPRQPLFLVHVMTSSYFVSVDVSKYHHLTRFSVVSKTGTPKVLHPSTMRVPCHPSQQATVVKVFAAR